MLNVGNFCIFPEMLRKTRNHIWILLEILFLVEPYYKLESCVEPKTG